jgi:hypothetical protein
MDEADGLMLAEAPGSEACFVGDDYVKAARGIKIHSQKGRRLARLVSHCNSSKKTGVIASLPGMPPNWPGYNNEIWMQ